MRVVKPFFTCIQSRRPFEHAGSDFAEVETCFLEIIIHSQYEEVDGQFSVSK